MLVLLSACAPKSGAEFRGLWIFEGEGVAFQPCGTSERWFATLDSALLKGAVLKRRVVFWINGVRDSTAQLLGTTVLALPQVP